MMNKPVYFLVVMLLLSACGSGRLFVTSKKVSSFEGLKKNLAENHFNYHWINARMRVKMELPGKTLRGTAYLKMRHDSLIWLSITPGLGIEAIRAKITRDSFYVLNRLNKTYQIRTFNHLNRFVKVRQVTFNNLENLLLGDPLFTLNSNYGFQTDSNMIHLEHKDRVFSEKLAISNSFFKLLEFNLHRNASGQDLMIRYSGYREIKNQRYLPGEIRMSVGNPEPLSLLLWVNDVSFKKREKATFGIPANYEKVQ